MLLAPLLAAAVLGGSSCSEGATRATVTSFVSAFNGGQSRRLEKLFAPASFFHWYSVGSEPGRRMQEAATNRRTLIGYFRARHRDHERLTLVALRFNGRSNGYGHFDYDLTRAADDLPGSPVRYVGKGAVDCSTGGIAVWSMAAR